MRFWARSIIVLFIGLAIFVYLHDGPPYFEWSDLFDMQLHHEKIFVALVSITALVTYLGLRKRQTFKYRQCRK